MKKIIYLLFFSLFTLFSVKAQEALPYSIDIIKESPNGHSEPPTTQYFEYDTEGRIVNEYSILIETGQEVGTRTESRFNTNGDYLSYLMLYTNPNDFTKDTTIYSTTKYNSNNQKTSSNYFYNGFQRFRNYFYDNNSCLIQKTETRYLDGEYKGEFIYKYERDNECNIILEDFINESPSSDGSINTSEYRTQNSYNGKQQLFLIRYSRKLAPDIYRLERKERFVYDDNGFMIKYEYSGYAGNEVLDYKLISTYENDSEGRPIELITAEENNDNTEILKYNYEYESAHQDYIFRSKYEYIDSTQSYDFRNKKGYIISPRGERLNSYYESYSTSSFDESYSVHLRNYNYAFDEDGYMLEHRDNYEIIRYYKDGSTTVDLDAEFLTTYQRRCDGAILKETFENLSNLNPCNPSNNEITIKDYHYILPADCEKALENYDFSIFPNPTSEYVNITSEILAVPGTHIYLFTPAGQMINQRLSYITFQHQIDFRNLPNGMYILLIENPAIGESFTRKIMVGK